MKSFQHPSKIFICFQIALMLFFVGISYAGESGIVKVSVDSKTGFPNLEIKNLDGKNVSILPLSDTKGSLGFEMNGKIVWLKGEPTVSEMKDGGTVYSWLAEDGSKIILNVKVQKDDLDLTPMKKKISR